MCRYECVCVCSRLFKFQNASGPKGERQQVDACMCVVLRCMLVKVCGLEVYVGEVCGLQVYVGAGVWS